jgi:hypothetical protein
MSDEDEEISPVPPRVSFVKVGIQGATPRDVREIDQSGDYRGIATPVRASGGSPFYRADAFDESEESDGMSSCSEGENDLKPRSLAEAQVRLSGSVAPAAPTWRWALDADLDRLHRCLAVCAPTHPLAATSPMVLIALTNCSLGPAAAEVLASVLLGAGNLRHKLHTLTLADNQLVGADPAASSPVPDLDLTGLGALCGALKWSSGLTALDLRRNVIGDKGLALLAGALWAAPTAEEGEGAGACGVRLQSLQLSENPLTGSVLRPPPPAEDDGYSLHGTSSDPRVGYAGLGAGWAWEFDGSSGGLRALLGAAAASIGEEALPFVLAAPSSFPPSARRGHYREIVSLGLRKCYLGPAGAELLVRALRSSSPVAALGRLDLYHNRVGDSGATALVALSVGGGSSGAEAAGSAAGPAAAAAVGRSYWVAPVTKFMK